MAKGMSPEWILVPVAILAILSGSLWPAMAKRNPLELNLGSWTLKNDLDSAVSIDCSDQVNSWSDTLQPTQQWSRQWIINQNSNEIFTCTFGWNFVQADFTIWSQEFDPENSYLGTCKICEWQIQKGGFYFRQPDGSFVREEMWN